VTAADTIGFDVPAWSARPANVPAGTVGVVGVVVVDGAEVLGPQPVANDTIRINTARGVWSFSSGMLNGNKRAC
jgi:hypothetical protein